MMETKHLKHLVLWKLADTPQMPREQAKAEIRKRLSALIGIVPTLLDIQFMEDVKHGEASYDMGILCTFDSLEAQEAYRVHPAHQAVSAFVKTVRTGRVTLDYYA